MHSEGAMGDVSSSHVCTGRAGIYITGFAWIGASFQGFRIDIHVSKIYEREHNKIC